MTKENKITIEFFERFGANKIWVVPSKENVETILDIHQFILKALASQRKEIIEKIENIDRGLPISNSCFIMMEKIINLIKEE